MLLTFGRSAFALPPLAGVVLAAGSATCSAVTAATAKADKRGAGAVVATAARSGTAVRTHAGAGVRTAVANAAGSAKKDAKGYGAALSVVSGSAMPVCALKGVGQLPASALAQATGLRTAKILYAGVAGGLASCEAEASAYLVATAVGVDARVILWGTTYEVGRGASTTTSAAAGTAQKIKQPRGTATCPANAGNTAVKNFASGFSNVVSIAKLLAGPRWQHGGIGYHDGLGESAAKAITSSGAAQTHPTTVLWAVATPIGNAQSARGAVGAAVAQAVGSNGVVNQRPVVFAAGATIDVALSGAASAKVYAVAAPAPSVGRAVRAATASVHANGSGASVQVAAPQALVEVVTPATGVAVAESDTTAVALRTVRVLGALSVGAALGDAGVLLNPLSASTFVIEAPVPDVLVEVAAFDNLVTVDAYDNLVEAA